MSLVDLDISSLEVGAVFKIENLFFKADESKANQSMSVVEEIYQFMILNPDITIEVRGHTNGAPPEKYCNQLSTARAKTIADLLYAKGINSNRITYKGYGKSQPIASNTTKSGRKANQRVEIKLLEIGK